MLLLIKTRKNSERWASIPHLRPGESGSREQVLPYHCVNRGSSGSCTENADVIYQKEVNTVDFFFNYCYFYYCFFFFLLLKALQSLEKEEGSVSACVLWVRELSCGLH